MENDRKLFCAQVRPYYKEKQLPALINFFSGTGGVTIYYSKEGLERIRKEAEEYLKKREEEARGHNYELEDGTRVLCIYCRNALFHKGAALLNTRGMTFFGLDWLNESAITLICTKCGFIHWFAKEVKQV